MSNDLMLLREMGESLDPPIGEPPADLRRRVLTGALAMRGRRFRAVRSVGARLAWGVGALSSVAAVAVAALLLAPSATMIAGHAPPGTNSDPGTAPAELDAGRVFALAAQHLANAPALQARPNQFVYTESIRIGIVHMLESNNQWKRFTEGPDRRRMWESVDGTRNGLVRSHPEGSNGAWQSSVIPGCRDGRAPGAQDRPNVTVSCEPFPAVATGLPTDPDKMLSYLYRPGPYEDADWNRGVPADQLAFERIPYVLYLAKLSPAVQAAVFQAAARIPGVTVSPNVVDLAGRHGIGVARTGRNIRAELLFDEQTYAYLGVNYLDVGPVPVVNTTVDTTGLRYGEAILRVAVVDRTGQMP